MVRHMFLPFYSKERGPPRIRMQVMGVKGKRFYKIVAANQRDPRDGKHMEVLGSYVPCTPSGVEELRLRFSRIKFWLAAGAAFNPKMANLLGNAGLVPVPPPMFGWRAKARYTLLESVMQKQEKLRERQLREYFKTAEPVVYRPASASEDEEAEGEGEQKEERVRRILR
ncbi:30s ribosomal protein S16, related [Neospora caninum Liverpool]|uniref:30S ribosomal protein S16, related n=1 Tax=Neospora caninum (strain Liverpool) TaxID=572307 RepID=F0VAF6_NEOCL|nr:30s ribosomal protein S16, related [Neospora caninum Liverpool]CBZ50645.1 30s ribosomal protein S16, related [Neospora caninum Liverpool]CEL65257.1 TPA: 30S ribosomal protein S16, related [Neospora caninum Liverpool]|eukprot:XP_003880678.1 30s ribosomal protein S16, related [Neospora caninum Liverpool]